MCVGDKTGRYRDTKTNSKERVSPSVCNGKADRDGRTTNRGKKGNQLESALGSQQGKWGGDKSVPSSLEEAAVSIFSTSSFHHEFCGSLDVPP